ncbi:hypothetical protein HPB50_005404 [Hyalomma asiaticum]|uniref:Uncharacterized protein n=1 Tax=Hyalomma asiaticum TaxID=266040 RepID=A0ACB7SLB6_HYAAI|nr:hypothetical protein HPB50_005404 [Hyalomma asiaticum]
MTSPVSAGTRPTYVCLIRSSDRHGPGLPGYHKWRRGRSTYRTGTAQSHAVMPVVGKLDSFDPNTSEWAEYRKRAELYFIANDIPSRGVHGLRVARKPEPDPARAGRRIFTSGLGRATWSFIGPGSGPAQSPTQARNIENERELFSSTHTAPFPRPPFTGFPFHSLL